MDEGIILDFIKKGESETVEFKSAFDQATIETLVAFANTKGGYVFVGVADSGKIVGNQLLKPPRNHADTTQKTTQKSTQIISTKERILDLLREDPNLTRNEMAKLLGKSQNTIKAYLAALKSEGWVERIGSDRKGYWKVK